MPGRDPHGAFDQGQHGDADSGLTAKIFFQAFLNQAPFIEFDVTRRGDRHRERATMKAPVVLVTAALTVAILLAASFLIATGTRGENALWPLAVTSPAAR
jgi:hypothetical protein